MHTKLQCLDRYAQQLHTLLKRVDRTVSEKIGGNEMRKDMDKILYDANLILNQGWQHVFGVKDFAMASAYDSKAGTSSHAPATQTRAARRAKRARHTASAFCALSDG